MVVEGPRDDRQMNKRNVQLAALDQPEELEIEVRLGQKDVRVRADRSESLQDLRQDGGADALEGSDPQRAAGARGMRLEVGLCHRQARPNAPCMPQQNLTRRRQADRLRAATPVDESLPHHTLQGRYLLADRRLRVAESGSRPIERTFFGHRLEREEVTKLDS